MENILKSLNGRQLGNQYCFTRNNKKFFAILDYSGAIDYGWRDLIKVVSADKKHSNVFKFKKGSFRDGVVEYWDNKTNSFIVVTDFADIVDMITGWIDFVT